MTTNQNNPKRNYPTQQEIEYCQELPGFKITKWETKEGEILYSVAEVQAYNKRYNNRLNAYDGIIDVEDLIRQEKGE